MRRIDHPATAILGCGNSRPPLLLLRQTMRLAAFAREAARPKTHTLHPAEACSATMVEVLFT